MPTRSSASSAQRAAPVPRLRLHAATAAALALTLSACAVGPEFQRPAPPEERAWSDVAYPGETVSAPTAGGETQRLQLGLDVPADWWLAFGNEALARRVGDALAHSPDLDAARATLRQARALVDAAVGGRWPSIDAGAGVTRQQVNTASFGSPGQDAPPFTLYNASVDVGYTVDIFGGVARTIQARAAEADFARFQLNAAALALATNVVTASIQEAALREQIRAQEAVIEALDEQRALVVRQREIGTRSRIDELAIASELATARSNLPALRRELEATRTQLAVYLGRTPAEAELTALELDALMLPPDLPLQLPSTVVRQRPDVLAAEASIAAATAEVGVATANLLPQLTLSGSWGVQSTSTGDLFDAGNAVWSVGANLLAPLFRGGTLRAQRRAAEAGLDLAWADYRATVLNAFKNVADALRAIELDAEVLAAQAQALENAADTLELVRTQYRTGAASYTQVLDATRTFQQARLAAIDARAARLADTAALYAALGGGVIDTEDGSATTNTGTDARDGALNADAAAGVASPAPARRPEQEQPL